MELTYTSFTPPDPGILMDSLSCKNLFHQFQFLRKYSLLNRKTRIPPWYTVMDHTIWAFPPSTELSGHGGSSEPQQRFQDPVKG